MIVNRLMWGAGYHVPEDYVTVFDRDRLVVDEDATIEESGVEPPSSAGGSSGCTTRVDTAPALRPAIDSMTAGERPAWLFWGISRPAYLR